MIADGLGKASTGSASRRFGSLAAKCHDAAHPLMSGPADGRAVAGADTVEGTRCCGDIMMVTAAICFLPDMMVLL